MSAGARRARWYVSRMTKIALAVLLALTALTASAAAAPVVGDVVSYRTATSQHNLATVVRIVSGTTVDLVVFSDGTTWQDYSSPASISSFVYNAVALGTSVGQYQATTIVADAAAAGGAATQSYVTSAISTATSGLASTSYVGSAVAGLASVSYVDAAVSGGTAGLASESYVDGLGPTYLKLPAAPAGAGLTLNGAGTLLSSTRPVHVVVRGTASMVSTLGTGQAFTVDLRCDSNTTPTAVVDDQSGSYTDALGVTTNVTVPFKLVSIARAGDRCRVVQSAGAATLSVTGSSAQTL